MQELLAVTGAIPANLLRRAALEFHENCMAVESSQGLQVDGKVRVDSALEVWSAAGGSVENLLRCYRFQLQ